MSSDFAERRLAPIYLALSAAGLVAIAVSEGYTDKAVIPVPGDKPTLGFGTTDGVKLGDRTTPPQALGKALRDVQVTEAGLKRCIHVALYQHEYDALVRLAYNVGAGAVCDSSIPGKLADNDYAGACRTILDFDKMRDCSKPLVWDKKKQKWVCQLVPIRGLSIRRQTEYRQCMGAGQ
ncbi:glycoside hydrolase family protein [Azonexus sp.]|uniref:glycoside hydrolase family protein n=1 Tax=Azonexus sp. TaxID=1872668 RepID=UPI0035B39350